MWPFRRQPKVDPKISDERMDYPDASDMLLQRREVVLRGEITDDVLKDIIARLLFLEYEDPRKPISLRVESPGGSISAGLGIADTVQSISPPVHTYAPAYAHGIAIVVLASGCKGERVVGPSATLLVTPLESTNSTVQPAEFIRSRNMVARMTAELSGQSLKTATRDLMFGRRFTATEAIAYGLADRVGVVPVV